MRRWRGRIFGRANPVAQPAVASTRRPRPVSRSQLRSRSGRLVPPIRQQAVGAAPRPASSANLPVDRRRQALRRPAARGPPARLGTHLLGRDLTGRRPPARGQLATHRPDRGRPATHRPDRGRPATHPPTRAPIGRARRARGRIGTHRPARGRPVTHLRDRAPIGRPQWGRDPIGMLQRDRAPIGRLLPVRGQLGTHRPARGQLGTHRLVGRPDNGRPRRATARPRRRVQIDVARVQAAPLETIREVDPHPQAPVLIGVRPVLALHPVDPLPPLGRRHRRGQCRRLGTHRVQGRPVHEARRQRGPGQLIGVRERSTRSSMKTCCPRSCHARPVRSFARFPRKPPISSRVTW